MANRASQPTGSDSFGSLLRRYRAAAGLTQETLAEKAGLSVRGISDLERELIRFPRRDTLQLLLEALALPEPDQALLRTAALRPLYGTERDAHWSAESFIPASPSPLIGREREVSAVAALLGDPNIRWVTLTGPGGVGKTTLAAAVARQIASLTHDAVNWVDLAHVRDPALVLPTVAQAMGIHESPGTPIASRLAAAISNRRVLLVVDNLEQVVDSASALAGLLARCANLQFLATSRVRLHIRAEQVVMVSPLAIPPEEPPEPGVDALARNPAVTLFIARAIGVRPGFALEPANAQAVAGICRRLDGLPLAIELAAARSAVLEPESLFRQLDHRLAALTQGFQDAPDRQRTMRNAIAWSHDILPPDVQHLFRRLAVFSGGFDLSAMTGVMHIVESPSSSHAWLALAGVAPSPGLIDAFQNLVDASLVQRASDEASERRYRMLETVREFAAERLAASDEERVVRNAHAAYFAALAGERIRIPYLLLEPPSFLGQVEADIGNVREALEWIACHGPVQTGLALAHGFGLLAIHRGFQAEALSWLDTFLATESAISTDLHVRALIVRGLVRQLLGLEAEADADDALALVGSNDLINKASALNLRGLARRSLPDVETALALCQEDPDSAAMAAMALVSLSLLTIELEEDAERATAHLEAALPLLGPGPTVGHSFVLGNLASLVIIGGDTRRAAGLRRQAMLISRQARSVHSHIVDLASASEIALVAGLPAVAARIWGASLALQERLGAAVAWFNEASNEEHTRDMLVALGDDAFASAVAAGRELRTEDALDEAMDLLADIANVDP